MFFGSEAIVVIVVSIAIHIIVVGGGTTIGSIIAVASTMIAIGVGWMVIIGPLTVSSCGCHIIVVGMTIIGRRGS